MAFTGITATEAEIDQKTGANVSLAYTDTMKTQRLLQAESFLNNATRFNWSDAFAGLNVDVKSIITNITASMVAIEAIKYNISTYPNRTEAEDMIVIMRDEIQRDLSILRDKKTEDFINDA